MRPRCDSTSSTGESFFERMSRAASEIVEMEREKLVEQEALRDKLVASLEWVG